MASAAFATDEELIDAFRSKDQLRDAFKYVYFDEQFRGPIFKMIQGEGKADQATAEDIWQDTCLIILDNLKRGNVFERRSKLSTYLYRIARNLWITRMNREIKRQEKEQQALEIMASWPTAEEILQRKENQALLWSLIDRLSPECQKVLSYFMQGMSLADIALDLGYKNAGVAKSKRYSCTKSLKKFYQDWQKKQLHGK